MSVIFYYGCISNKNLNFLWIWGFPNPIPSTLSNWIPSYVYMNLDVSFTVQWPLLFGQINLSSWIWYCAKGILLISSMNSTLILSSALDNGPLIQYLRGHPSIQFNLSCLVTHFLFPCTQVQIWVWFLKRKKEEEEVLMGYVSFANCNLCSTFPLLLCFHLGLSLSLSFFWLLGVATAIRQTVMGLWLDHRWHVRESL